MNDTATMPEDSQTAPVPPPGAKIKTRTLPCKLTVAELARYGSMLSGKVNERDRIDEERKIKSAEYGAAIKGVDAEISRLAAAIDAKEELRPVDTFEHFVSGTVQVIRVDTGDVVTVRPATQEERQLALTVPGMDPPAPPPEHGAPGFPALDDGPRGDELAAPEGEAGELVESSMGDRVYVSGEDEETPFDDDHQPDDEGEDLDDVAASEEDEDELDVAYQQRKAAAVKLKAGHDAVVGGEVHSAELKQGKKTGPKGPRKPKAAGSADQAPDKKARGRR